LEKNLLLSATGQQLSSERSSTCRSPGLVLRNDSWLQPEQF
jgi:hypothetical protein